VTGWRSQSIQSGVQHEWQLTAQRRRHYSEVISHAVLVGTAPPGPERAAIQQVWLERALKPINDLDDEEILFFEPKSESSRRAARMSRDRI
jgi:hypothetical protein